MAKLISSKYLKNGDVLVLKDGTEFGMTNKSITKFHNDNNEIYKVVRKISKNSPRFIGITNEKPCRIAFYITADKKYATTNFYESRSKPGNYFVTLWIDEEYHEKVKKVKKK